MNWKTNIPTTRWSIIPWFPGGPGGGSVKDSEAEALAARERMLSLGYEDVRIIKTTTEVYVFEPRPRPDPAPPAPGPAEGG